MKNFLYVSCTFILLCLPCDIIGQTAQDRIAKWEREYAYEQLQEIKKIKYEDEAFDRYEILAKKEGCVEAYEYLAYCYENGYVVKQDFNKALQCYRYLLQHKDDIVDSYRHPGSGVSGISRMPYTFHVGIILKQMAKKIEDEKEAINYFRKAAADNNTESMYWIGDYFYRLGDYKEAVKWLVKCFTVYQSKFSQFRNASTIITTSEAYRLLSDCYKNGLGVDVNEEMADSLTREASKVFKLRETLEVSDTLQDTCTNHNFNPSAINIEMVHVQGGVFQMGATPEQKRDISNDIYEGNPNLGITPDMVCYPVINVMLDDYYIGKYEITQKEWCAIMGYNNSKIKGDNYPVHNVCWYEIQEFISRLNKLTGKKYRLPKEAEWEYAARGGRKGQNYIFIGGNKLNDVAWTKFNSTEVQVVGQKSPNELGLYDMAGNVYEWCDDWMRGYGTYNENPVYNIFDCNDKKAIIQSSYSGQKIIRGGSTNNYTGVTSSYRWMEFPNLRLAHGGFRLCESVK